MAETNIKSCFFSLELKVPVKWSAKATSCIPPSLVCVCVCDSLHLCHLHADDVIFYRMASFRHRNVRLLDKVIWSRITTIALIQATKRNSLKFDCLSLILFFSTFYTCNPSTVCLSLPPQTDCLSHCCCRRISLERCTATPLALASAKWQRGGPQEQRRREP